MTDTFTSVSTDEFAGICSGNTAQIVDVRSIDAYNGWPLNGEARGGHIAGARALPAKWAEYIDWIEIVHDKGLDPEQPLVVYGSSPEPIRQVAVQFQRAGFGRVRVYDEFIDGWCRDDKLPMQALARHRQLVPPAWLKDRSDVVICHAHYQNPDDYSRGHIPGALAVDTNWLESTETWNRRSPEEVRSVLERLGISRDTKVVLYGRFSHPRNSDPFPGSSAGQLAAFRLAFIMLWAGVGDVRVLNGGIQSWLDEGLELDTEPVAPEPVADFGADIPVRPELAVDLPEAHEILASEQANLVCVRSYPEVIGEVSGYHYIDKKGRIPGAVFASCGSDAYHMENYRNLDHTTREYHEVEAEWRRLGITPDKRNAFYCGTGWRGSEAFFNAWLMGWERAAVFDGGWFEWSSDESNPIETGELVEVP